MAATIYLSADVCSFHPHNDLYVLAVSCLDSNLLVCSTIVTLMCSSSGSLGGNELRGEGEDNEASCSEGYTSENKEAGSGHRALPTESPEGVCVAILAARL